MGSSGGLAADHLRHASEQAASTLTSRGAMDVILAGVDLEHLESAVGTFPPHEQVSFGTMLWQEPPTFPRDVVMYIYAVTRGSTESVPAATWRGFFSRFRRREDFASRAELDATRPKSTLDRRDHPDENEREPEWAGYLMVTHLHRLDPDRWVPLSKFRVSGKPFKGTVVRHPVFSELD
jgi:hypothetical protein